MIADTCAYRKVLDTATADGASEPAAADKAAPKATPAAAKPVSAPQASKTEETDKPAAGGDAKDTESVTAEQVCSLTSYL